MNTKSENPVKHLTRIVLSAAIMVFLLLVIVVLWKNYDLFHESSNKVTAQLQPNPFEDDDFSYVDGYMTCLAADTWTGIDVSHHQGQIRWEEVADAGIRYAMIRVAHRAVSDGVLRMDRYWENNITGARNAGLLVGVYFYSQATSVEEAREEAAFVLDALDGIKLDFPVVFDWEVYSETGRNANVDPEIVNACAIAFCEAIRDAGYEPMVYFNLDLLNRFWDLELLQQQGYSFWLAMYRDKMNWNYCPSMWQYTESGSVPGIDTPVDLNLLFLPDE